MLGSTIHDWGWPKNGPIWTKNGQKWQACQRSKVVQKGLKGTKRVNLSLFDHLGPFWAQLDPYGPFQTRIDILLCCTSAKPHFVHLGQKNHFCLKWSKRVQIDPKGVPNGRKDLGWPFWSLVDSFGLNIFAVEVEQQNSIWNILMIEVTNFGHEKVPNFTLTALCPTMPKFQILNWERWSQYSIAHLWNRRYSARLSHQRLIEKGHH